MTNRIFRLDDRLIHGQVIVGWVKRLNLDCIIVANDRVIHDPLQKNLFALAIPEGIQSFFVSLEEGTRLLNEGEYNSFRFIVLVESLQDVLTMVRHGLVLPELNIGGLHFRENKKKYSPSIFLDDDDLSVLNELMGSGIKISSQPLPDDPKVDMTKMIQKKESE